MKIKLLIFCILPLLAFTGCTKSSGPSSVSGQVVDQITGRGVPYAQVVVIGQNSNVVGAGGNQGAANATADGNGNFSINFTAEPGNSYEVNATAKYYLSGQANSFTDISAGKNTNVKVYLKAEGFIRFYLVNMTPLDTVSEFDMSGFHNAPSLQNLYKDTTSFILYSIGNTQNNFGYTIHRGSTFTNYTGSIYLKSLDTVNFTINY